MEDTKTSDYQDAAWFTKLQHTANTITKRPSLILTGVSQWILHFFQMNMNMIKQKTQNDRENEHFVHFVLQLKRTKTCSSVKHQVVKTNHDAQKCANYHSENTIFSISNHPQTWRIGELSAPNIYIYMYIYMYVYRFVYNLLNPVLLIT